MKYSSLSFGSKFVALSLAKYHTTWPKRLWCCCRTYNQHYNSRGSTHLSTNQVWPNFSSIYSNEGFYIAKSHPFQLNTWPKNGILPPLPCFVRFGYAGNKYRVRSQNNDVSYYSRHTSLKYEKLTRKSYFFILVI